MQHFLSEGARYTKVGWPSKENADRGRAFRKDLRTENRPKGPWGDTWRSLTLDDYWGRGKHISGIFKAAKWVQV